MPDRSDIHMRSRSRRSEGSDRFVLLATPRARRFAVLIAAAVMGVVVLATLVDAGASWGRIHPGVWVGEVPVGSMTPDAARAAVSRAFSSASTKPVTVVYDGQRWRVARADIDARIDATGSVDAAMAVGRHGGLGTRIAERISASFGGVTIRSLVQADERKTAAILDRMQRSVALASVDASVSVRGGTVTLLHARTGRRLERGRTRSALLGAFLTRSHAASLVVVPARVSVSDADARRAYADARRLLAGPVRITYGKRIVDIPAATVAGWVSVTRHPVSSTAGTASQSENATGSAGSPRMTLAASFDPARIGNAVDVLVRGLEQPARDASFAAANGSVRIRPSQIGRGPDLASLASELTTACLNGSTRSGTLRLTEVQPKLTTSAARAMGITSRLSTFTTQYSAGNAPRVNNVHLLAKALDSTLIAPGDVFSFNGTAGERTSAKGYVEAPAIVDGKLVPQLGGGVCQVGTTVFNAVFFSGLPVVERHNHSFYISHYPKGRDATVSWGGPDFKFRNDTNHWILIRTAFTSSSLTVALYGTDPGYVVSYTTGKFTKIVPFKVDEVKDPTLAKGKRIVQDAGENGCDISVVRTVKHQGQLVRMDTFVSHYSAKVQTVRVGTKSSSSASGTVSPKR